MQLPPEKLYICPFTGICSDGTNMHDWSPSRLKSILDYCWYKDIADLAKSILKKQKEEILKLVPN